MLDTDPPEDGWTKSEIATSCGLSIHGGAAAHVDGLAALGILEEEDGRYFPAGLENALFARVADLVEELERVPEVRIDELRGW